MSYISYVVGKSKTTKGESKTTKGESKTTKGESKTTKTVVYQLITDVDDTLHPSGVGVRAKLAGVDPGNKDVYYPCVGALHRAIYNKFGLPTVVVSANPFWKSNSDIENIKKKLGIDEIEYNRGGLFSSGWSTAMNMFPGTYRDDYFNYHFSAMANVKIAQIKTHVERMRKDYVGKDIEYRAIWIGDNGQGDLLAAKELLQQKLIYAALIHTVDINKQTGRSSNWARQENPRLFPFDNYETAITKLQSLGSLEFLEHCNEKVKLLTDEQKGKIKENENKYEPNCVAVAGPRDKDNVVAGPMPSAPLAPQLIIF